MWNSWYETCSEVTCPSAPVRSDWSDSTCPLGGLVPQRTQHHRVNPHRCSGSHSAPAGLTITTPSNTRRTMEGWGRLDDKLFCAFSLKKGNDGGKHEQTSAAREFADAVSRALGPVCINSSLHGCSILSKLVWSWVIFRCSKWPNVVYMWCCGSDGCRLFIMTQWQVYSAMLYKIQALSQIQNVKIDRNIWCDKNRLGCLSVLWKILSSWLHQGRQLHCVIRLSVCLNWFSSSVVQVGDHQYIPSLQGVSVVYDRKK